MQLLPFLYSTVLALLALAPSEIEAAKAKVPKDAVLLSSIKTLTLRHNAKTSHRRVSAVPQLSCTGPGCKHYSIDVMRCTNQGSSYGGEDIEWSCTASIPEEFKLGSTEVACEGYSSREDDYVLKGSCGVEYRLLLTSAGEEKYGSPSFWGGGSGKGGNGDGETSSLSRGLFMIVFVGVLLWIIYSIYVALPPAGQRQPRRPGGGWGGWGGGGAGGGDGGPDDPWDPPPPYPGKRQSYGARQQQEGWRPGFWSGAMGGAAAGYMAGNRGNRQTQAPLPQQRGGGWFGGNSNSGGDFTAPRRSTSSSSSSTRHESTGFGSTSRR